MVQFTEFTNAEPIPATSIATYLLTAPEGAGTMWRDYGTGTIGDGFFRVVDPAELAAAMGGVHQLPEGGVVLFSTALADLIVWQRDTFFLVQFRWGRVRRTEPGVTLEDITTWMQDPTLRQPLFDVDPYPAAAARDRIPALRECFGFVPLLALGGPDTADHLQLMGFYEHVALITTMAGQPRLAGTFAPPT